MMLVSLENGERIYGEHRISTDEPKDGRDSLHTKQSPVRTGAESARGS